MVYYHDGIGDSYGDGVAGRVGNDNDHKDFDNFNDGQQCGGGGGGGTMRTCWCTQQRLHLHSI